jgi:hypothetical protein
MNCVFNLNDLEIYEIGTALAAILACPPGVGDDEKRSRYQIVLCAEALRAKYGWDEEWRNKPQHIKPIYAFHPLRAVKRDINTINRQLQNRLHAAHVAIAFLKQAETGQTPPDFPKDAKQLSINEMVRTLTFSEKIDIDNFETRIWRPSLPVIHLAAAFAINTAIEQKAGKKTSLGDIIFNQEMISDIIHKAELYESLLLKSKLRLNKKNLVRIRLA